MSAGVPPKKVLFAGCRARLVTTRADGTRVELPVTRAEDMEAVVAEVGCDLEISPLKWDIELPLIIVNVAAVSRLMAMEPGPDHEEGSMSPEERRAHRRVELRHVASRRR